MTVKEIVEKYLKENKFEGLYSSECGCDIEDLMPCGSLIDKCIPGHRKDCGKCIDPCDEHGLVCCIGE